MLPYDQLSQDLNAFDTGIRSDDVVRLAREKLADSAHGRLPDWRNALTRLPELAVSSVSLQDGVTVAGPASPTEREALQSILMQLKPWRKGPFQLFGIKIDAEWRSDLKWDRLLAAASSLRGRRILDVGCGNGYYALRAIGGEAAFVLGIDPTVNHLVQFLAVQKYARQAALHVLPLRLHELGMDGDFDTTISMGVLYHQRSPQDHLSQLRATLRMGGELILETLVLPGDDARHETPVERYARMRNVWMLPTVPELLNWLELAGFNSCKVADVSVTTNEEQRTTAWMPFQSLADALDPKDDKLTVEGMPRPRRALLICTRA